MKITLTTIIGVCSLIFNLSANEGQSAIGKILVKSMNAKDTDPQLVAKFVERKSYDGCICNEYNFYTRNLQLKPGQKLIFSTRNCLGNTIKLFDAYVDNHSNIIIILHNQQVSLENLKQIIGNMALGESVDYILSTPNYENGVSAHLVVNPIESYTNSGQKIYAELRSKDGSLYEIFGEGFLPNEKLKNLNLSENEGGISTIEADEFGKFRYWIMPKIENLDEGTAHTTIYRTNSENLTIHYQWGRNKIKAVKDLK